MERADQMVIHTSQSKYRERRSLPRYSREVIALVECRVEAWIVCQVIVGVLSEWRSLADTSTIRCRKPEIEHSLTSTTYSSVCAIKLLDEVMMERHFLRYTC